MNTITTKQNIEAQKQQLKLLINWLQIVEECEASIVEGKDVQYYKSCKAKAVEGYANSMSSLFEMVITLSKYQL